MFCPRCGQQAAEGVSFCSRCGLPLEAAAEFVATGGAAGLETAGREPSPPLTPRQRGTRKGLVIIAAGVLFFLVAAFLTALRDELFPFLIIAGVVLVIGVARTLYGLLLEEHAPPKKKSKRGTAADDSRAELGRAEPGRGELPPAQTIPASLYTKPGADTSDMHAPAASVTESTTRLLEDEEGAPRNVSRGGL